MPYESLIPLPAVYVIFVTVPLMWSSPNPFSGLSNLPVRISYLFLFWVLVMPETMSMIVKLYVLMYNLLLSCHDQVAGLTSSGSGIEEGRWLPRKRSRASEDPQERPRHPPGACYLQFGARPALEEKYGAEEIRGSLMCAYYHADTTGEWRVMG